MAHTGSVLTSITVHSTTTFSRSKNPLNVSRIERLSCYPRVSKWDIGKIEQVRSEVTFMHEHPINIRIMCCKEEIYRWWNISFLLQTMLCTNVLIISLSHISLILLFIQKGKENPTPIPNEIRFAYLPKQGLRIDSITIKMLIIRIKVSHVRSSVPI